MASNYDGDTHTLTTGFELLSTQSVAATHPYLNVRNNTDNGRVELSPDGVKVSGFLLADEGRQFQNMSPDALYVRGTAGQSLYWDVT